MARSLELGVSELFRDAVMESTTLELRTKDDWSRFREIQNDVTQREQEIRTRFESDRRDLIAKAREELLRRAGSLTHEHPTPFGTGTDKFDKTQITKQAERMVDQGHQSDLLKLREAEAEAYSTLRDSIRGRENVRGQSREAFARAVDRRSGEDRRGPARE